MPTEPLPSVQAHLASQDAAPSHLRRLAALRELCERSPQCIALALVGSFAQNRGDRISDLDLAAFVSDGSELDFGEQAHEILARDPLLFQYSQTRPGEVAFRKYIFLDSSSCEFHTFNLHTPFKLRPPFLSIWDPENYLQSLVVAEPPPRHEDFTPYPHGDVGLVWELYDCIKWLLRGRHQLAKDYLRKLVAAMDESKAGNLPNDTKRGLTPIAAANPPHRR